MTEPDDLAFTHGVAPYRRLEAYVRLDEEVLGVATEDMVKVAVEDCLRRLKHHAHTERTILSANKPRVVIEVRVKAGGWQFPEEDQEVYENERIAQTLGSTLVAPGGQDLRYVKPQKGRFGDGG